MNKEEDFNQWAHEYIRMRHCACCKIRVDADNGLCQPCKVMSDYIKTGIGCPKYGDVK